MSFFSVIAKNLIRQPVRAALTVLGIAIGITTVVALGIITGGMEAASGQILRVGGADFMAAQKGISDLAFSSIAQEVVDEVARRPDVAWASGMLLHIVPVGGNPYFVILGVDPNDLAARPPALQSGALLAPDAPDQMLLGDQAAAELSVGVGDSVTIERQVFQVVGIYHTGDTWQDGGAQIPLATAQRLANRPEQVTFVYVKVTPGRDAKAVAGGIEADIPQITTISTLQEYGKVDQGFKLLDAANLAISALAVGIGAIGVMNTMVMSVFERTREIGILRAVGWSGGRILRMIVSESLLLCLVAMGFGTLLGVLAARGVLALPAVRTLLTPTYPIEVFVRALVVAVVVALVGAAYPAYRAVRMTPMEALRHE